MRKALKEKFSRHRSSSPNGAAELARSLSRFTSSRRSQRPADFALLPPAQPDSLGLSLLAEPEDPVVDIIFVHGLGGTSRATWCKDKNPELFWPKEWLPHSLPQARIHTYGYNANFASTGSSIYGTLDFSKQLLFEIAFSPLEFGEYPIVFVAHSMGGLVVKKLYTLARQDPQYQRLVPNFFGIVFLATPHRGSNCAQILQNLLRLSIGHSAKAYMDDLVKNSVTLQTINEDFRHVASDLKLVSFYESLKTPVGPSTILIVEKDSAILGYSGEVSVALNADHHTVCKFSGITDPNYIAVRNVLVTLVRQCKGQVSDIKQQHRISQMETIYKLLSYRESPEDDLLKYQQLRLEGSCEWITEKEYFREWLDGGNVSQLLWLNGIPASGKSVLSAYTIEYIQSKGKVCQYFFFHFGGAHTSGSFLRSLAVQLAGCNESVRKSLVALYDEGMRLGGAEARMIWQKVFVASILRIQFTQPLYWVIDALDESESSLTIIQMLGGIQLSSSPFRILVLSRSSDAMASAFNRLQVHISIVIRSISVEDTLPDIRSYVTNAIDLLPGNEETRKNIVQRVLQRSAGCFLWVRLAIEEVQDLGHTQAGIEAALEDMPAEMDKLYQRAFDTISKLHPQNQNLARAIIRWTICSVRPLTLAELSHALQPEVGEIFDIERTIVRTCAHLLVIDHRRRVVPVHQTVRDFLSKSAHSEFGVVGPHDHERLTKSCLEFLVKDLQGPGLRGAQGLDPRKWKLSPIVDYAASSWSDHLRIATADSDKLLDILVTFLQDKVLSWIAFILSYYDLYTLTHTAQNMKAFLERRAKIKLPVTIPQKSDSGLAELWAVDLVRLVTKFGKNLTQTPSAIFQLLPPLCPKESIIYRRFGASNKNLSVSGRSNMRWNDCISRIPMAESVTAIAGGDIYFALALASGAVIVLNTSTCQETRRFEHSEYVSSLQFNSTSDRLLSGGAETVRVWDISTGRQTNAFYPGHKILSVAFSPQNTTVFSASCNSTIKTWDLVNDCEIGHFEWSRSDRPGRYHGSPVALALHAELGQIAVSYRGFPVSLWDIESQNILGDVVRKTLSGRGNSVVQDTAICLDFNRETGHLVLGYSDGTMIKWDPITDEQQECDADAQTLSCSDNGVTIGTGDSFGNIKIWNFVTLELIHHISTYDPVEHICFSPDGLRFYDIRGTYCSAWEPDVLVRATKPADDQSSFGPVCPKFTDATEMPKGRICTLVCDSRGEFCAYGRDDGCIYVSSATTGSEIQKLYSHASTVSVVAHIWSTDGELMATADNSRRFILRRIICNPQDPLDWQTVVLVDARASNSVRQLLLSSDEKNLLVFTISDCEIWTIEGVKLQSFTFDADNYGKWTNHPLDSSQLLCLETSGAHVFDGESSHSHLTPEETGSEHLPNSFRSLLLPKLEHGDNHVTKIIPSPGGRLLVAEVSPKVYTPGGISIMLWESADIVSQQPKRIVQEAESLIGVYDGRIVFLDKDLWVCSWNIGHSMEDDGFHFEKHFFLPQDWMNGNEAQLCAFTLLGNLVFASGGELAVIGNGLQRPKAYKAISTTR